MPKRKKKSKSSNRIGNTSFYQNPGSPTGNRQDRRRYEHLHRNDTVVQVSVPVVEKDDYSLADDVIAQVNDERVIGPNYQDKDGNPITEQQWWDQGGDVWSL